MFYQQTIQAFIRFCYTGKIGTASQPVLKDLFGLSKVIHHGYLSQLCLSHLCRLQTLIKRGRKLNNSLTSRTLLQPANKLQGENF